MTDKNDEHPATEQAFLLLVVDTRRHIPSITSLATASSRTITEVGTRSIPVLTGWGTNYEEGLQHLREQLGEGHNEWLVRLLRYYIPGEHHLLGES